MRMKKICLISNMSGGKGKPRFKDAFLGMESISSVCVLDLDNRKMIWDEG